jgi:hypothetical protein
MGNRVPQGFSIKSAEHNWINLDLIVIVSDISEC